ncbi:hypothetical protein WNY37_10300 [Henriciella sp. AS95]|uniref:hypothetical protein n=1 Tax=Henriciella sp. AS95 TaxID=3135782 RepID=UPI00317AA74B
MTLKTRKSGLSTTGILATFLGPTVLFVTGGLIVVLGCCNGGMSYVADQLGYLLWLPFSLFFGGWIIAAVSLAFVSTSTTRLIGTCTNCLTIAALAALAYVLSQT